MEKGFDERLDKIEKILRLHTGKSLEELEIFFPLKDKSKVEVMRLLPQELLNLTWSCRYPKIVGPWEFGRCHECPQCGVIDKVIEEYPNEFPEGF